MTISVTVSNIELMTAADIARLAHMLLTHNGHASPMVANPPTPAADAIDPVAQPLPVISFPEVPAPAAPNPFAERGEYQSPSLAVHQSKTPFSKPEELQINHAAAGDLREPAELQQAPGIDVDKAGLPWDGRIHASTRAKNADGTWRMRRGIEEALVAAVTGELRQTMAPVIPQPPVPAVTGVPKPPFVPSVVPSVPQASITPETATRSTPLVGVVPTVSPSDAPSLTFPKLMQLITTAFTSKALSQEQIKAAIEAAGLPSLPMLASRPDLVQGVADSLGLRA